MSPDCYIQYKSDRVAFEIFLYGLSFAYLLANAEFLPPKNEGRRHCLAPYRPLLDNNREIAIEAARTVGWRGSVAFLAVFSLLQLIPPVALAMGLFMYYPECGCKDGECGFCIFTIDYIPVASCTGLPIFLTSVCNLMALVSLCKTKGVLGTVRNATLYSNVAAETEQELAVVEASEQELV